ncbi:MAG: alkaline phosphatase family protein, partial [Arthrobacter sp.]|nr:alkaline phosphatase family protein [Arthrobacter sp.]
MATVRAPEPFPVTSAPSGSGPLPTLLPAAPAFGHRSVAEVLSSAAASIGVPGFENRLGLPAGQRIC